jgi:hypothetical protein
MKPGNVTCDGLALDRAADWVLAGLRVLAVPWFKLRPAHAALAVDPDREWRCAYPSVSELHQSCDEQFIKRWGFRTFRGSAPSLEEAIARGIADQNESAWSTVLLQASDKWPELPPLIGSDGLIEWLRAHWVDRAESVDAMNADSMRAALAVPVSAVARLAWLSAGSAAAARVVSIVQQVPVDARIVQPAGGAWPHAYGTWSEAEKTAIHAMRAAGMTEVGIAKVAGVSRDAFRQQIGSKTPRPLKDGSGAVAAVARGLGGVVVHRVR